MTTAGWLLVAGFAVFMSGAMSWRLQYQGPAEIRLPALHADRTRLRWIHSSMLAAMVLTPAGLAAVAAVADHPAVWAAAAAYAVGAIPWILHLTFRLTVQERAAAAFVDGEAIPDWYEALESWVGLGHRFHMAVAYASAVPAAWGLAEAQVISGWLAWAGAAWGVLWLAGLAIPRTRFAFEPPFWAHVFTLAIGIAIL